MMEIAGKGTEHPEFHETFEDQRRKTQRQLNGQKIKKRMSLKPFQLENSKTKEFRTGSKSKHLRNVIAMTDSSKERDSESLTRALRMKVAAIKCWTGYPSFTRRQYS